MCLHEHARRLMLISELFLRRAMRLQALGKAGRWGLFLELSLAQTLHGQRPPVPGGRDKQAITVRYSARRSQLFDHPTPHV
jgi:hypothetical protein